MRVLSYVLLCAATSVAVSACDSESSGSLPTSASPTTSAIAVTVNSPLEVDETAQAAATASLTNGQSQAVTTGWQSDAPNVATVTLPDWSPALPTAAPRSSSCPAAGKASR